MNPIYFNNSHSDIFLKSRLILNATRSLTSSLVAILNNADKVTIEFLKVVPPVQSKITVKAIISAFEGAESLEALNEKWQKAQQTDYKNSDELKVAYDKKIKELV